MDSLTACRRVLRAAGRRLGVLPLPPGKSRHAAAALAMTLGPFGAHHWYIGRRGRALLYAFLALTGVSGALAAIEAACLLAGPD